MLRAGESLFQAAYMGTMTRIAIPTGTAIPVTYSAAGARS